MDYGYQVINQALPISMKETRAINVLSNLLKSLPDFPCTVRAGWSVLRFSIPNGCCTVVVSPHAAYKFMFQ